MRVLAAVGLPTRAPSRATTLTSTRHRRVAARCVRSNDDDDGGGVTRRVPRSAVDDDDGRVRDRSLFPIVGVEHPETPYRAGARVDQQWVLEAEPLADF